MKLHRHLLASLLFLASCAREDEPLVCQEMEGMFCEESCSPVTMTCTYEDLEATGLMCPDGCSGRMDIVLQACNTGVEASLDEIEAGTVCEVVETTPN